MADGERRMLFDTRGKRKHVIRVVYAILALLMGASLFLVVGPFNLAELTGGSDGGSANEVFEEQAERIEGRLAKDPQDEGRDGNGDPKSRFFPTGTSRATSPRAATTLPAGTGDRRP